MIDCEGYHERDLPETAPECEECGREVKGVECKYCHKFPQWLWALAAKLSKIHHDTTGSDSAVVPRSIIEDLITGLDRAGVKIQDGGIDE